MNTGIVIPGTFKTYSMQLPVDLVARIKDEARRRSIMELRSVGYSELIRQALNNAFPAPTVE